MTDDLRDLGLLLSGDRFVDYGEGEFHELRQGGAGQLVLTQACPERLLRPPPIERGCPRGPRTLGHLLVTTALPLAITRRCGQLPPCRTQCEPQLPFDSLGRVTKAGQCVRRLRVGVLQPPQDRRRSGDVPLLVFGLMALESVGTDTKCVLNLVGKVLDGSEYWRAACRPVVLVAE